MKIHKAVIKKLFKLLIYNAPFSFAYVHENSDSSAPTLLELLLTMLHIVIPSDSKVDPTEDLSLKTEPFVRLVVKQSLPSEFDGENSNPENFKFPDL